MTGPRPLTFAALALLVSAIGCLNVRNRRVETRDDIKSVRAEVSRDRPPLDEAKLKDFGMDFYWDSYIPNEILIQVTLQGKHLYAITESNRIYQLDMQSGRVKWVFDVGVRIDNFDAENPIAVYEYSPQERKDLGRYNEVFFTAGDVLYALDMDSGSELWRVRVRNAPISSPPVASLSTVFVGSWDDRVYAISKIDQDIKWFYRTNNDILARPAAGRDSVFLASSDGNVYRLDADADKVIWPFHTELAVSADPLLNEPGNLLYIPSDDYTLYAVGTLDGRLEWQFETGGRPIRGPVGIAEQVFSVSSRETFQQTEIKRTPVMHAFQRKGRVFNKTEHDFLWTREGASKVLAAGLDDIYVLEDAPQDSIRVSRLDKNKGFFRDAMEFQNTDFTMSNTFEPAAQGNQYIASIVFLGYRNGWILALKEKARR